MARVLAVLVSVVLGAVGLVAFAPSAHARVYDLRATPDRVSPQGTVTITGRGCLPQEWVTVRLEGGWMLTEQVEADHTGAFGLTVPLQGRFPDGTMVRVRAACGGDPMYPDAFVQFEVDQLHLDLEVVLSPPTQVYGQPVTAAVHLNPSRPVAGTVTLRVPGRPDQSVAVSSGLEPASFQIAGGLAAGHHPVVATFAAPAEGDRTYEWGANLTVVQASSSILLAAPDTWQTGVPAAVAAAVTAPSGGSVQFTLNGAPWGPAAPVVNGGAAMPDVAAIPVGDHEVGARFIADDPRNVASSAAARRVSVTAPPTSQIPGGPSGQPGQPGAGQAASGGRAAASVALAVTRRKVPLGKAVRAVVTVAGAVPGSVVKVRRGRTVVRTIPAPNGSATVAVRIAAPGAYKLRVVCLAPGVSPVRSSPVTVRVG